jgi:hypothetical protein
MVKNFASHAVTAVTLGIPETTPKKRQQQAQIAQ